MFRDARGRRRRLPRSGDERRGRRIQDNRGQRLEHRERNRGGKCRPGRARFSLRRLRAAIVGSRLRDLRSGRAVLVMMHRTRAVLAARHARFGRPLPAGTLGHGTLRQREQADDRRQTSQGRSHTARMRRPRRSVKCGLAGVIGLHVEFVSRGDSVLAWRQVVGVPRRQPRESMRAATRSRISLRI